MTNKAEIVPNTNKKTQKHTSTIIIAIKTYKSKNLIKWQHVQEKNQDY